MELMAINEKQTIKNAKKKLREYPRWREIAHDSAEQRITANYTFEPRSKNNNRSNIVETLALRRMNAINELEAIEEAHRNIIDELKQRGNVSGRTIQVADKGLNCINNILHALNLHSRDSTLGYHRDKCRKAA